MHFLEHIDNNLTKYDLINKLLFKSTKKLPKLKQIVISFSNKSNDINFLATNLIALELIAKKKGTFIQTKHNKISLKIRKGDPVGYKIKIKKLTMYHFITKLIVDIFPKLKDFKGLRIKSINKSHSFSYTLTDLLTFKELENHYYLFNNLTALNLTFITNASTKIELLMILKAIKLPFN